MIWKFTAFRFAKGFTFQFRLGKPHVGMMSAHRSIAQISDQFNEAFHRRLLCIGILMMP
jgi:hypothetical protein